MWNICCSYNYLINGEKVSFKCKHLTCWFVSVKGVKTLVILCEFITCITKKGLPYFLRNLIPSSRNEVARVWVGGGGLAFNVFLLIFSDQPFVLNMSVYGMPYEFNICTCIFTVVKLKVWLTLNCLFYLDKQIVKNRLWFTICLFKFLCRFCW